MEHSIFPSIEEVENESGELDFKASFDPTAAQDWCELIKDIVAMANSGGGLIVIGVNDDGSPATGDLVQVMSVDPATIVDKLKKYTDQHVTGFSLQSGSRRDHPVAILKILPVRVPIVFTAPGTYEISGAKQKTAFSKGTVYFRHGAKSEPGTSEDLKASIDRELDRIRSSWLDGIQKVVTAPVGATISVLPGEVELSGGNGTAVRLVNDESAPAFKAVRTDLLYPYRQKELVAQVNKLLGGRVVSTHDIVCVRKIHRVDSQPTFFYKPQYSSPQYSDAFAQWMADQHHVDEEFFEKTRQLCKKNGAT